MTGPLYISVIGPGASTPAEDEEARQVGHLIAGSGAVLVCGGLGGVMEAAARGAREAGGTSIGILPGHVRSQANPFIEHAIPTGLGEARNLIVVSCGDAVIAVGGGYGTLSEMGLAAKIGRPVVVLHGWRLEREAAGAPAGAAARGEEAFSYASSPEEALALVHRALGRPYPPAEASPL